MAMLAVPRKKTKWTLNPRGKFWSEDSNKFGQKLLEKMGWKEGKGLGAKEQGITSHIHVQAKNDNSGIGFKGKDMDWCKHQSQFDDILANLNQNTTEVEVEVEVELEKSVSVESLEKRSKASKARLHYHKFTRGKDVSTYSSKDLGCILGVQGEKPLSSSRDDSCKVENIGGKDDSFGVKTIIGGSISDYLNRKQCSKSNLNKEDEQEDGHGSKRRKVDADLESQEIPKDVKEDLAKDPLSKRKTRKHGKKVKSEEGEVSREEFNSLKCADDSKFIEGNMIEHISKVENSERKSGKRGKKSKVLNSLFEDECSGVSQSGVVVEVSLSDTAVEKKKIKRKAKNSKDVPEIEITVDLSFEGINVDIKDIELDLGINNIAEEARRLFEEAGKGKKKRHAKLNNSQVREDVALEEGNRDDFGNISAKTSKKGTSIGCMELEECNPIPSTDTGIVRRKSRPGKGDTKEQVVDGYEVSCEWEIGVKTSKEEKKYMKINKKMELDVKSEMQHEGNYYSCINPKEIYETLINSSKEMFSGANLNHVKGYGV